MWSCQRGAAAAGGGRLRLEQRVDPEVGPAQRREQLRRSCGAPRPSPLGGLPVGALHPPLVVAGSTIANAGCGSDEHERVLGLEHAVDLAEHPVDVLHRRQAPHGHDGVDRVGPDEGQLGEGRVVQLDLHAARARRRRGRRPTWSDDSSTPMTLAPCLASAMALCPAPHPRSRIRLPSTWPSSFSVSSRATSGP